MQLLMATQSGDDVPERELPWIGFAEAPTDRPLDRLFAMDRSTRQA
jgi:hypothetical protein